MLRITHFTVMSNKKN